MLLKRFIFIFAYIQHKWFSLKRKFSIEALPTKMLQDKSVLIKIIPKHALNWQNIVTYASALEIGYISHLITFLRFVWLLIMQQVIWARNVVCIKVRLVLD